MFEFLQDPTKRNIAIIVAVALAYYFFVYSKKEGFSAEEKALLEADSKLVLEKRMSDEEIQIKPTYVDNDVRSLMSGSGFIPQHDVIGPFNSFVDVNKYGIVDGLDDGEGGSLGLQYNLVSPACCSPQYPTSFKMPYDKFICNNKDQFAQNNYFGNNSWQNSGCMCLNKKQADFISSRGNNA